ncbi:MAG: hypothetical protein ACOCP4_07425 [Candidatus Woesearchaeota archaeon]
MVDSDILILVISMIFFVALPVSVVIGRLNSILSGLEDLLSEKKNRGKNK